MKSNILKSTIILIIILLFSIFNLQIKAQEKPQIFAMAGYLTNSSVTVAAGELKFKDDVSYSLGFDIPVDRYTQAEISWTVSPSHVDLSPYYGSNVSFTGTDLYIHTFQAGAVIEPKKQKARPFGLLSVGASLFAPSESKYSSEWLFSFALGGGLKYDFSDRVGLRLQARLIVPVQFAGTSIWFGTGGGGVSVGAYSTVAQGDFSGGLYIRL
jgi:hypothetical protein